MPLIHEDCFPCTPVYYPPRQITYIDADQAHVHETTSAADALTLRGENLRPLHPALQHAYVEKLDAARRFLDARGIKREVAGMSVTPFVQDDAEALCPLLERDRARFTWPLRFNENFTVDGKYQPEGLIEHLRDSEGDVARTIRFNNHPVGFVRTVLDEDLTGQRISWWVSSTQASKGFTAEAARNAIHAAFDGDSDRYSLIHTIIADTNIPSRKIAQRLGFEAKEAAPAPDGCTRYELRLWQWRELEAQRDEALRCLHGEPAL